VDRAGADRDAVDVGGGPGHGGLGGGGELLGLAAAGEGVEHRVAVGGIGHGDVAPVLEARVGQHVVGGAVDGERGVVEPEGAAALGDEAHQDLRVGGGGGVVPVLLRPERGADGEDHLVDGAGRIHHHEVVGAAAAGALGPGREVVLGGRQHGDDLREAAVVGRGGGDVEL